MDIEEMEALQSLITTLRQAYLRDCAELCVTIWEMDHDLPDNFMEDLGIVCNHELDFINGFARAVQERKLPGTEAMLTSDLSMPSNPNSPTGTTVQD